VNRSIEDMLRIAAQIRGIQIEISCWINRAQIENEEISLKSVHEALSDAFWALQKMVVEFED
jgi:hypothetical protein